jgi:myosin heavy subunit
VADAAAFACTVAALRSVGLTEADLRGVWACLSLVLLLGDVAFADAPHEGSAVAAASLPALAHAAALAGVTAAALEHALTVTPLASRLGRSGELGAVLMTTKQPPIIIIKWEEPNLQTNL